jgi:uncharacterized protein
MTPENIRVALENAVGIPDQVMRAAASQSAQFAPTVIAAAQSMAHGRLPLLHEEKLLRFGLHALAAAHEATACAAFLALLRRSQIELDWLFGEDREPVIAKLLLSLFDGNEAAVSELIADPAVDEDVRSALMLALARLAWDGRASRDRLLALLDRLDDENAAPTNSLVWLGWQEAILLLGATDRTERVQRGWDAGRLAASCRDVDQQDWLEQVRAAADHHDDPRRFARRGLVPIEDPAQSVDWSALPPHEPGDALDEDELAWLDLALLRTIPANGCLEEADGLLTALAAGPGRATPSEWLPEILRAPGENSGFDSPEHKSQVIGLLKRRFASLERDLAGDVAPAAWVYDADIDMRGTLWARGYLHAMSLRKDAWEPLIRDQHLANTLVMPLLALLPDEEEGAGGALSYERRSSLIRMLPDIALATKAHCTGSWHPLLNIPLQRTPKIGRNDLCPCGSGKKYKRCCAAA